MTVDDAAVLGVAGIGAAGAIKAGGGIEKTESRNTRNREPRRAHVGTQFERKSIPLHYI